jgi:hypothetical protein
MLDVGLFFRDDARVKGLRNNTTFIGVEFPLIMALFKLKVLASSHYMHFSTIFANFSL